MSGDTNQEGTAMAMTNFEKRFVNNSGHSRRVGMAAARLVNRVDPQPGQTFLDVGTGNGETPIYLAQVYGLITTGVDVDSAQIALADAHRPANQPVRFMVASATTLPFENGEFQIVSTAKTTHHIPDWPAAIAEMVRVLKPGGHLIYRDFVLPAGLGRVMARLAHRPPLPNLAQLSQLADQYRLITVFHRRSGLGYTVIWQKPTA
jgi:ubiquinone/menaquinone biosynthesis C-methylase UbiE